MAWNKRSSDAKTSLLPLVPVYPAAVQQAEARGHFQVLHSPNRMLLAYSVRHWPSWPSPLGPTCLFSLGSHSVLASGTQSLHLHNGNSYQPCLQPSLGTGFRPGAGRISKQDPVQLRGQKLELIAAPGASSAGAGVRREGTGGAAGWEGLRSKPPATARIQLQARPSPRARPAPLSPLKCRARASCRRTFTLRRRIPSAPGLGQPAAG